MKKFYKIITGSLMIAVLGFGMTVFTTTQTCEAAGNIHHRGRTTSFFQRAGKPQKAEHSILGDHPIKKIVVKKQSK